MAGQLYPRSNCAEHLRHLVSDDLWLARFALSWVIEEMELGALNDLVEAVDAVVASESYQQMSRNRSLLLERFGR